MAASSSRRGLTGESGEHGVRFQRPGWRKCRGARGSHSAGRCAGVASVAVAETVEKGSAKPRHSLGERRRNGKACLCGTDDRVRDDTGELIAPEDAQVVLVDATPGRSVGAESATASCRTRPSSGDSSAGTCQSRQPAQMEANAGASAARDVSVQKVVRRP